MPDITCQIVRPVIHFAMTSGGASNAEEAGTAQGLITSHTHAGTTNGSKLAQANTHESADTDSATSSLHHTIGSGANQAAAGNHGHTVDRCLVLHWSGGGSAITTGHAVTLPRLPFAFTPTSWSIQCSAAAETAAASAASIAFDVRVDDWSTSGIATTSVGGTLPSVSAAVGATAAAAFTDAVWAAGQMITIVPTGTPTAYWAVLAILGTSVE